jgi:LysM repeat protein
MSTLTISPLTVRRPTVHRPTVRATTGRSTGRSAGRVAGPAARVAQPARLTRRGRLVVTLALVAASTGVLGLAQPQAFAIGRGDGPVTQRITVRPGETLWGIAERVAPDADPRATIARLESMNHLASSTVPAGSVLVVPVAR